MNTLPQITTCPGTLAAGFNAYSNTCLKRVFNGKKVSYLLPYNSPQNDNEDTVIFLENRRRISISGVQEKLSLMLDKNKLRLTSENEQGNYILKPVPRDLQRVHEVPANEHLTMQIARQVYRITTAENALIFFKDGAPAYVTKRFDVKEKSHEKWGKEDFATLAGKTAETAGEDFKYEYNYEAAAGLIKQFVPAYQIETEKFFSLILFNYLFSNGDAHLKNFSLLETPYGDYALSPAYDLINTKIHVNDSALALNDGLFKDDFCTASYDANGFYAYDDFYAFGLKTGMIKSRVVKMLKKFTTVQPKVKTLITQSYLSNPVKVLYLASYEKKLKALNYSLDGKKD